MVILLDQVGGEVGIGNSDAVAEGNHHDPGLLHEEVTLDEVVVVDDLCQF